MKKFSSFITIIAISFSISYCVSSQPKQAFGMKELEATVKTMVDSMHKQLKMQWKKSVYMKVQHIRNDSM